MALHVENLGLSFGGLKVIQDFSLSLERDQILGLIGPNGAGKTTIFNLLSGIYKPLSGLVRLDGKILTGLSADEISKCGVVRTFQNIRLFPNLSVLENVMVSHHKFCNYTYADVFFKKRKFVSQEQQFEAEALELLKLFKLEGLHFELAGSLPYGVQRKLEIIRALAGRPQVLLLDEPAAGMNQAETGELMALLAKIRETFKLAMILIEHDMKLVMGICDSIVVLDHGVVIARGSAQEIRKNPKVIEAYLGEEVQ